MQPDPGQPAPGQHRDHGMPALVGDRHHGAGPPPQRRPAHRDQGQRGREQHRGPGGQHGGHGVQADLQYTRHGASLAPAG